MTCPFITKKSPSFSKFPYINFSLRSIPIWLIWRINYNQGLGYIYSLLRKRKQRGGCILRERSVLSVDYKMQTTNE